MTGDAAAIAPGMQHVLIGRETHLAALAELLGSVRSGMSAALVLAGEPGIGKSVLLDHLCSTAGDVQVKRVSGLESESHLGFAGIHRIVVPFLGDLGELPPVQAEALRTTMGLSDAPPPNAFILGLAMLSIFNLATRETPLLCVVDDAQFLDEESIEILGFVARRLHAERVGLVFGVRDFAESSALDGIPRLELSGMPVDDATDLLMSLARGRVDRTVARQVAERCRGNPLVIVEVSKELTASGAALGLLLDDPLPLGARLERHFRRQLDSLPRQTQALLLLVACHPDPDLRLIWAAARADGIDPEAARPASDALLIAAGSAMDFRHPLIRSAVHSNATPAELRHAHSVLAAVADPRHDGDLHAWHRAAASTGPDESVAEQLETAARAARSRGGFLSESTYLARAAALSPNALDRATRLLDAAQAALTGGAPLRAQSLLEAGLPDVQDPYLLARLQKLQANALHRAGRPGNDTPATLLAAATVFADFDADLARETMLEALEQTFIRGSLISGTTAHDVGRAALDQVTTKGDLTDLLLESAGTYLCVGHVESVATMRRALDALAHRSALADEVPRWFALGVFLAQLAWDVRAAYEWLTRCEEIARRTGAIQYLIMTLVPLSGLETSMGRLAQAEARMQDVRQLSSAVGMHEAQVARIENARLMAWLGREDSARAAAANTFGAGTRIGAGNHQRLAQQALIIVELGRGRYVEAFDLCRRLVAGDELGVTVDTLPDLIEAGVRSGHREEASLALDALRTRAVASGSAAALGVLARCEALLAGPEVAGSFYETALRHLAQPELVIDEARTHLLFGEWLRRQKKRSAAREHLRIARDTFDDIGAVAFALRSQAELEATGERMSSPSGLTSQEAQIAELAGRGATNQEIATQLFISSHTVEYHLRKIFRKLGVTSRRRLTDALHH